MTIKKGDFIEIDFTGKFNDGSVFDTTLKSVAEKNDMNSENSKSFVMAVGHEMLPKGFDDDLIGKEIGKDYTISVPCEKAFGLRDRELVKMIPTKLFFEQKIRPERGMQLILDNQIVKIVSVSGGRTLVDFNGPLAGKDVVYDYRINKVISDEKEKLDALQDFFFKQRFESEVKDNQIVLKVDKKMASLVSVFAKKFKDILGKEIVAN